MMRLRHSTPHRIPGHPAPGVRQDIVTHNDINLDNVVFRDSRAVALIDFDLAGPGTRAWDVACAARLWAPLRPDIHISDRRRGRKFERFRLFVDSYGVNDSERLKVVEGVQENYMWFYRLIKSNAASGHAAFAKLWSFKTMPRAELAMRWHAENKADLRAALGIEPPSVAHGEGE
jgi:aminoglycoside phosphotransferase (APT) family kinase protein